MPLSNSAVSFYGAILELRRDAKGDDHWRDLMNILHGARIHGPHIGSRRILYCVLTGGDAIKVPYFGYNVNNLHGNPLLHGVNRYFGAVLTLEGPPDSSVFGDYMVGDWAMVSITWVSMEPYAEPGRLLKQLA